MLRTKRFIIPGLMMTNQSNTQTAFRLFVLFSLVLVLAIAGCSRQTDEDDGRTAEEMYEWAKTSLDSGNWSEAVRRYRMLNSRYPFGRHAEQSQLDMAYAFHRARQPDAALSALDRFIRTYPTHPNVDYAWYLKGLVHYEEAMGFIRRIFPGQIKDRDQESARAAFNDFQELVRQHPESRYVPDARQRMVFLRNAMAEYEVTVGEYYERRGARIAAVNRAKYVLENYPGAPATYDALVLMERNYEKLGMDDLAMDTRRVREHNYPDGVGEEDPGGFFSRLWPFN